MPPIVIPAPAKLNLFLHVTGKQPDGYHLLESLIVFTHFGDSLEIEPADELALRISGPYAGHLEAAEDNLVMRAARMLNAGEGASLHLRKNIPVGAGLGGGSADAAAALRGLSRLWDKRAALPQLALALGSDVPVCLESMPAMVEGIGERITPVCMEAQPYIVLANPNLPLLTSDVFRHFSCAYDEPGVIPEHIGSNEELVSFLSSRHNALEAPAKSLLPVIGELLRELAGTRGCLLSRMSGSGATCFALYHDKEAADGAVRQLNNNRPDWWAVSTRLYGQAQ